MRHYHNLELGKRRIMFRNWWIRSQHVEADLNKNSHSGLKTTTESTLYGLLSLTCCIVFQSESSSSAVTSTRLKMKKEMVACRCLARRQGITTIKISQHGWCIWITIRNSQWIMAENVDFCFADFTIKNITTYQYVSKCRKWNWINCPIGSWIVQVQSIPFL